MLLVWEHSEAGKLLIQPVCVTQSSRQPPGVSAALYHAQIFSNGMFAALLKFAAAAELLPFVSNVRLRGERSSSSKSKPVLPTLSIAHSFLAAFKTLRLGTDHPCCRQILNPFILSANCIFHEEFLPWETTAVPIGGVPSIYQPVNV